MLQLCIVHVTGLQTRAGTRVWVRRVQVRVVFEVPAQNPHPCDGFGGFISVHQLQLVLVKVSSNSDQTLMIVLIESSYKNLHTRSKTPQQSYSLTGSSSLKISQTMLTFLIPSPFEWCHVMLQHAGIRCTTCWNSLSNTARRLMKFLVTGTWGSMSF